MRNAMKKMKKIGSLLLALFLGLSVFAACDNKPANSSTSESSGGATSEEHVHDFGTEWKSNSAAHWKICACGQRAEYAKHSGTAKDCNSKRKCDTCGREYGSVVGHTYDEYKDGDNGKAYYCDCGASVKINELTDFTVEVEEGREPVILQLSDPQIMYNTPSEMESKCFRYIRETVEETNPDLILVTGDLTYGQFDTADGDVFTAYVNFMESLETPWAPVFGNHDNECPKGVDWQCEQLENAENCLFEQGEVTGNGNYTVGVTQGEKLLRVFYMMDSNGCGAPSDASLGKVKTSNGFGNDQVDWFCESIDKVHSISPETKISFAYHIQQAYFLRAFKKYEQYSGVLESGSSSSLARPLNLEKPDVAQEGDFGYLGRVMKGAWDENTSVFIEMKKRGVDSIFVGHEHCNSASIVLDGVRFQYGQKSSTYDRYNFIYENGDIDGDYNCPAGAKPLIGGTVFELSQTDGSIINPYIYLCDGQSYVKAK